MLCICPFIGLGSTHDVTVTDDFDESFQDLAISRHRPDGGRRVSITEEEPESFAYNDVKRHTLTEDDDDDNDEPLIQF